MSILKDSFIQYIIKFLKPKIEAKQDELVSGTNIKTINGTSLLGSGNVSIEGGDSTGDVDEGRLVWSEEAVSQGTIIDGIMYNANQNGLAFMNPSCIDVYYSTDNGDTWQDYGLTTTKKVYLVTPITGNYSLYLGKDSTNKSVNYRLRVDLRIKDADIQFIGKKLYLKWSSNTSSDAYYIDISVLKYENSESNEWTHIGTYHKQNTLTIPLNGVMGYNGTGGILSLRIEAYRTGTTEPRYNSALTNIAFLYTACTKGNNFGRTGLPMTIDTSQNSIFPAYVKAKKFIPNNGTYTQVLKGDGSLEEESNLAVASALDAEYAQEADYAGVADKADKLTTARTITLGGGVTSTSAPFDGTRDISLTVYDINDMKLSRGYNVDGRADYLSLTDLAAPMFASNRFAFINPDAIIIQKSNDGGNTWEDYSATNAYKTYLTSNITADFYMGGKNTAQIANQDRLRITITRFTNTYISLEAILLYIATGGASNCFCKFSYIKNSEYNSSLILEEQTFTEIITCRMSDWSGWNRILQPNNIGFGNSSSNNIYAIRLDFWFESYSSGYENTTAFSIRQLVGIGRNVYSNNSGCKMLETGHMYSYDWQKNVAFPAAITATKHITQGGTANQVVLGNGNLKEISDLIPITNADVEILLNNHIHSLNVTASGNDVNINVIESSKNGNNWETEDNDITIPLATTTSAGVMSKEDKAKLDGGNVAIDDDSGMPDLIGDYYDDVDMVAEISLRQYYQPLTEGCLYLMNAIEGGSQCIIMFIYRSDGCIPISTTNTNTMKASISGTTLKITGTDGSGELRIKQIKLK